MIHVLFLFYSSLKQLDGILTHGLIGKCTGRIDFADLDQFVAFSSSETVETQLKLESALLEIENGLGPCLTIAGCGLSNLWLRLKVAG